MTPGTVALCPPLPLAPAPDGPDLPDLADALLDDPRLSGVRVLLPAVPDAAPDDDRRTANAHWVAHLAIGLATGGAVAPVLLVLVGAAGELAPALGFSQKASRRAVSGYVLVDAVVPPAESRGGDWPDAPVVYVASPSADPLQANQARLRGWDVVEVSDASAPAIAETLARIVAG
ncbi:MAG: hypothetical protein AB7I24_02155 [Candidatus Nanopelagicales bacterium]